MKKKKVWLMGLVLLVSCQSAEIIPSRTLPAGRSFALGFTPWPYEATLPAIDQTYQVLAESGDIVAHHFQQGLPYSSGSIQTLSDLPRNIQNEVKGRLERLVPEQQLYLAIDSLNSARTGQADYWGSGSNQPVPSSWQSGGFESEEYAQLYLRFSLVVLEAFTQAHGRPPEYFNYGTEASDLLHQDPQAFAHFVETFAPFVYSGIKAAYPETKLMISAALKDPSGTKSRAMAGALLGLSPYVDILGISAYPYAFYGPAGETPGDLPENWLSIAQEFMPGKPLAVTETGWIAQDLRITDYGLRRSGSEALQEEFLWKLFNEVQKLQGQFIIWFTHRDFDALWEKTLGQDPLSQIWRDTGLWDEQGEARAAGRLWMDWLALPLE